MAEAPARRHGARPTGADDTLAALVNLLVVLADNKYRLGWRVSEWSVGAPSLEAGVAIAAIAQGELGQARVVYPLLEELGFPGQAEPSGRERSYSVSLLDGPLPTWSHAVAALLLVDGALTVLLEALAGCAYTALARRVPRMLEEEEFHRDFAQGRARELARVPAGKAALQDRIGEALPELLCWFGPSGEPGVEALRRESLLAHGNRRLRQTYLDRLTPLLEELGVTPAIARDAATGDWDESTLPWRRWNRLQRRLEPEPAP